MSLFEQLNQLAPSPGISPANGPNHDRNDLTLSFPCDGNALQAQLEQWTNVAFDDFDSPDNSFTLGDDNKLGQGSSPAVEDRSTLRYAGAFSKPQLHQHHAEDASISPDLTSIVDLSALLGGSSTSSFASADPFAPSSLTSGSLVDPSLSLPSFGTPAPTFPSFFASPNAFAPPTPVAAPFEELLSEPTPAPAPTPAPKAAKGKKASSVSSSSSGAEKKKRAPSAKVSAKLQTAAQVLPLPEGVDTTGMSEEQLNALAVEEDKRRRNTAASARFRVKKKQREQALEETAKELRDRVALLEKEVDTLRTENGWLRGLIVDKTIDGAALDGASNNKKRRIHETDASSILV